MPRFVEFILYSCMAPLLTLAKYLYIAVSSLLVPLAGVIRPEELWWESFHLKEVV